MIPGTLLCHIHRNEATETLIRGQRLEERTIWFDETFETAMEFEQSWARLRDTMGATEADIAELQEIWRNDGLTEIAEIDELTNLVTFGADIPDLSEAVRIMAQRNTVSYIPFNHATYRPDSGRIVRAALQGLSERIGLERNGTPSDQIDIIQYTVDTLSTTFALTAVDDSVLEPPRRNRAERRGQRLHSDLCRCGTCNRR